MPGTTLRARRSTKDLRLHGPGDLKRPVLDAAQFHPQPRLDSLGNLRFGQLPPRGALPFLDLPTLAQGSLDQPHEPGRWWRTPLNGDFLDGGKFLLTMGAILPALLDGLGNRS